MFNIIMIGPQGSGKGTQAELLAKKLGIPTVSTGQVLRAETDRQTGLGREIGKYMKAGDLVPSDIIFHVMTDRLGEQDTEEGVIIDGYPRTVEQAKTLDDIMTELERHVTHVFYIDITDEIAVKRISGRRVCSNPRCGANYHVSFKPPQQDGICDSCGKELVVREDDNPEAVHRRLEHFHQETQPLVEYYKERNILHRFDGDKPIEEVNQAMVAKAGT